MRERQILKDAWNVNGFLKGAWNVNGSSCWDSEDYWTATAFQTPLQTLKGAEDISPCWPDCCGPSCRDAITSALLW